MADTGTCKHGEFNLVDGCPQCLEEKRFEEYDGGSGSTLLKVPVAETVEEAVHIVEEITAIALRPGDDVEAQGYFEEAMTLLEYAERRVIATVEDVKAATDDLALISHVKKLMEAKKREYLDPLKLQSDAIRETYDYLMGPVFEANKITKDKMLAYQHEQSRIRHEQEEINRKRMEAAEAEMRLKGELSESVNLVEVVPEAPKRVSTEMGSSGVMKIRKYRVVNFVELPDQYKIENSALLNKVVKAGIPSIPGVEIYLEDTLRVTPK